MRASSDQQQRTEKLTKNRTLPREPSFFTVILHNDDYTPMNFVIHVLQKFFNYNVLEAERIMLTIHRHGKANCGVFTADIAEVKCFQVNTYAKACQHPLLCTTAPVNPEKKGS